jgi:antirestriction protein ArdC
MSDKTDIMMRDLAAAFIAALEEGIANPNGWVAPWHSPAFSGAVNASTKRPYTGGNALWLGFAVLNGATAPFATYRQWEGLGAQVRKGEKGITILVPKPYDRINKETGKQERGVFFGAAVVFAASQVDGWTPPAAPAPLDPAERNADADAWLDAWHAVADVRTAPGRAFFHPTADYVSLPAFEDFHHAQGFYSTTFHEATHWTGGSARLDRIEPATFGTPLYAREELVAELGSAAMGNHFGITTGLADEHRDYLANWIRVIKNDPKELWDAASAATKATKYLLALLPEAAPATTEGVALAAG